MSLPETQKECPNPHRLKSKAYKKPYMCDGCREQGHGERFRCDQCNYDLHKSCVVTNATTSHKFYKNKKFEFVRKLPSVAGRRRSDACTREICGFVYSSCGNDENKNWDLHPCCFNLEPELSFRDGEKDIKFHLKGDVQSKCMWCEKKNLRGSVPTVRGRSYQSKCKKYEIHVYCVLESALDLLKYQETSERENVLKLYKKDEGREHTMHIIKIMLGVLKTVASTLLGDPTEVVASLLSPLLSN